MGFEAFKRTSSFFIPPLIILSLAAISYLRLMDNYELGALDFRFRIRSTVSEIPVTDKIMMIEIGEDSIKKIGRFPFDRSYHAVLIKALSEFGAKTILFDIFFSEPQKDDRQLEEAIGGAGNVYLPFAFDIDAKKRAKIMSADDYLAKCLENFALLAKGTGHINLIPDIDGKFRRVPVYAHVQNRKVAPHALGPFAADGPEVFGRIRVRPVEPLMHVPVPDRIVQDVVQRGPEVAIRLNGRLQRVAPHLAPAARLRAVPLIGGPTVQPAQFLEKSLDVKAPDEQVIVIGQECPREYPLRKRLDGLDQ